MEFFDCVSLIEARRLIMDAVAPLPRPVETVSLLDAVGRVAALPLAAPDSLPAFSRSTVDGFAVRSADTFGAGEAAPVQLNVVGEVGMGRPADIALQAGEAVLIHTGGMLPEGADAVAMVEHTEQFDQYTLLVLKAVAPGENVVFRGEDIEAGCLLAARGQKIGPRQIGLLAASGIDSLAVFARPRVAVISTGDELVDIGESPGYGQVRDINSYTVAAMLTAAGCTAARLGIIRDSFEEFLSALSAAVSGYDMVVLSGGSSVGSRDHTVGALRSLGEPGVIIHGIAIKPGKPTIFGMAGDVPVFGLPGHPAAAMMVCEQLLKPAIRVMLGQPPRECYALPAVLARNVPSVPGRDDFLNVRVIRREDCYNAEPILGKSALIAAIAAADGIVHIPFDKSGLYDGDQVEVLLFEDMA